MPSATNSDIDIASRALILIGAEPITSFDGSATENIVANNTYEDVIRTCLTNTRWRFATNQEQLVALTDAPSGRFSIAHQLPSDLLMLHAITVQDTLVEYQVYGDKVFSDRVNTDNVIADFTFRATENTFPPYFILACQYTLASVFAASIARDDGLVQLMTASAERYMAKARSLDSQIGTTARIPTSRFIAERRG